MGWKSNATGSVGYTAKERQAMMRSKTRSKATKPGSLSDRVAQGGAVRMTSAEARVSTSVQRAQDLKAPWC